MNKVHFTDEDGFVIGNQVSNTIYEDGKSYSAGSICRILPPELINKNIAELRSYQFFEGAFIKRAVRPTDHITKWNPATETWIEDLTMEMAAAWSLLKTTLYDFITISSAFPIWKQVNYSRMFNELTLKKLTVVLTIEEQSQLDTVEQVMGWMSDLFHERDRVKDAIFMANTAAKIKAEVQSMNYMPPPFLL